MSSDEGIDWTPRPEPSSPQAGNGSSPRSKDPRRRPPRWGRRILILVTVLILALAADAAYTGVKLNSELRAAAAAVEEGVQAIGNPDLPAAEQDFATALEHIERSDDLTRHPSFFFARMLPMTDADARAVDGLIDASRLATMAGTEAVSGLEAMGVSQDGVAASVYSDGQVHFDALAAAEPYVERVEELLRDAVVVLERLQPPRNDRLREALDEVAAEAGRGHSSASRGVVLMGSLPSLLAEDTAKSYLLTFQSPSEARGTGGVAGLYGVLTATDGRLQLEKIGPYSKLTPVKATRAPDWFKKRYRPFRSLGQWPQANMSPVFPVVASVQLQMYESSTGESLDGVLSLDPIALAELTKATGPLQTDQSDVVVGPDNAVDFLLRESYLAFDTPAEQDRFLAAIVQQFWRRISDGDVDPPIFASALSASATGRHLLAYSAGSSDQAALNELGVDGGIDDLGPNVQMVFHNNVAVNKVDYFLQRSIETTIQLDASGDAEVTTEIALHNASPIGPPSPLLGPGIRPDPPGLNRMYLNVLMPQDARLRSFAIDGKRTPPLRNAEIDFPVAWEVLEIPAGENQTLEVVYTMRGAFDPDSPNAEFNFSALPQATVTPDALSVVIIPPDGYTTTGTDSFEGTLTGTRTLTLLLKRP